MILWKACGENCCGRERESQKLNYGGADPGATAENEDVSWLRSARYASREEGKRYFESRVDDSRGGAIGDAIMNRQGVYVKGCRR